MCLHNAAVEQCQVTSCLTVCTSMLQDIEANLLKQDIAKAALKQQHDQPAAVAKALELNDAAAMRKRGRMMLPAPQVCGVSACSARFLACWSVGNVGS